uniref:Uncharacterized protein n=1 Tax=Nelumbo nucifera TaxID=4432 RepID=A0A822Z756_NELNU|nr:TPA_asm: hypothetical protein HUJ06_015010 [Nelumbo nucifera]
MMILSNPMYAPIECYFGIIAYFWAANKSLKRDSQRDIPIGNIIFKPISCMKKKVLRQLMFPHRQPNIFIHNLVHK